MKSEKKSLSSEGRRGGGAGGDGEAMRKQLNDEQSRAEPGANTAAADQRRDATATADEGERGGEGDAVGGSRRRRVTQDGNGGAQGAGVASGAAVSKAAAAAAAAAGGDGTNTAAPDSGGGGSDGGLGHGDAAAGGVPVGSAAAATARIATAEDPSGLLLWYSHGTIRGSPAIRRLFPAEAAAVLSGTREAASVQVWHATARGEERRYSLTLTAAGGGELRLFATEAFERDLRLNGAGAEIRGRALTGGRVDVHLPAAKRYELRLPKAALTPGNPFFLPLHLAEELLGPDAACEPNTPFPLQLDPEVDAAASRGGDRPAAPQCAKIKKIKTCREQTRWRIHSLHSWLRAEDAQKGDVLLLWVIRPPAAAQAPGAHGAADQHQHQQHQQRVSTIVRFRLQRTEAGSLGDRGRKGWLRLADALRALAKAKQQPPGPAAAAGPCGDAPSGGQPATRPLKRQEPDQQGPLGAAAAAALVAGVTAGPSGSQPPLQGRGVQGDAAGGRQPDYIDLAGSDSDSDGQIEEEKQLPPQQQQLQPSAGAAAHGSHPPLQPQTGGGAAAGGSGGGSSDGGGEIGDGGTAGPSARVKREPATAASNARAEDSPEQRQQAKRQRLETSGGGGGGGGGDGGGGRGGGWLRGPSAAAAAAGASYAARAGGGNVGTTGNGNGSSGAGVCDGGGGRGSLPLLSEEVRDVVDIMWAVKRLIRQLERQQRLSPGEMDGVLAALVELEAGGRERHIQMAYARLQAAVEAGNEDVVLKILREFCTSAARAAGAGAHQQQHHHHQQ